MYFYHFPNTPASILSALKYPVSSAALLHRDQLFTIVVDKSFFP